MAGVSLIGPYLRQILTYKNDVKKLNCVESKLDRSTKFLCGLVIDDVRVALVGLGCQASKASVPRRGWQPSLTEAP